MNILRRLNRRDLKRKYYNEWFANEIMLLPYYIASLNIEHAYYDQTGEYEPFEGICFADTLDLAESQQLSPFAEENIIEEVVGTSAATSRRQLLRRPNSIMHQHLPGSIYGSRQQRVSERRQRGDFK